MNTLSYVLYYLSKLLAPLTPFISEIIYQKLKNRELVKYDSVHLEFWPDFDEKLIDIEVLNNMEKVKEVVRRSLELRDNAKIPVRQVLEEVKLKGMNLTTNYLDIIGEVVNVKRVTFERDEESEFIVELNTDITPELKLEGIARNLIRHLNNFRKQLNLSTKKRIDLFLRTDDREITEALEKYKNKIKKMIQADKIFQNLEGKQDIKRFKIENKIVEAFIEVKS
jgi:isoleucyl-tRNA synthetase